jgi:predicted ester cyclase
LLPNQDPGREGYILSVAEDHAARSHIRYIVEEQIAEGDKVITRFTIKRIHDRGEYI